jgi:saccharopine dehydrogenase (NAD+, L-lysine forming)
MRLLLVGVGGVGEAFAIMAQHRPWIELVLLADYNLSRAKAVQARLGDPHRFPAEFVDASSQTQLEELAQRYRVDMILNACDPQYNVPIFEAAFSTNCHYTDMAMTLSEPHPQEPHRKTGVKLGDYQFERAKAWEDKGLLALVGMGVEPGMSDVFARFAQDHLIDEIDEIGVRDGSNLVIHGYDFAPTFSIWTTIEECLNPPVIWEKERGWHTTEPFSGAEIFNFPAGIGPLEVVNVEHEEVLLIPRWVRCRRVTFKYGLGEQFITVLKTLHKLGLDSKQLVEVRGLKIAPRDVVAACLPDPSRLGDRMVGKTCAGTWVKGIKDGQPRQVYLYQVADNEYCMQQWGCQAVVAQTAVNPLIAMDLLHSGAWHGKGVLGPEAFDAAPYLDKMAEYGFPSGMQEM